ncbi:MAG: hypothetical protein L6Q98_12330 [Anaerolineae bacterium]|nr:hypothetical protein [Anaerolineae bacterium]NUQ06454.1 hypothetical protein [Anaerolineae bacterium]
MLTEPAISPREIVESFKFAYAKVNNCDPIIVYRGNHWYIINGEAVHRTMVMREIARLRGVAQRQTLHNTDRSILTRLINKLRGL